MSTLGAVACGGRAAILLQTEACEGTLTWQGGSAARAAHRRLVDCAGIVWAATADDGLVGVSGSADVALQPALAAAMAVPDPAVAPAAAAACLARGPVAADACLALSWQGQVAWIGAAAAAGPAWISRGHRAHVRVDAQASDGADDVGAAVAPLAVRHRLIETALADLFIWLPTLDDDELAARCRAALSLDSEPPRSGDTAVCWLASGWSVRSRNGVWQAVTP
jgi:hypothetical protein